MRKTIFASLLIITIVLVALVGCGSNVNNSIEGTWIRGDADSDSASVLTFAENEFTIVHHSTGWGYKGTYSINNDEMTWVVVEVEVFDWENDMFTELFDDPNDIYDFAGTEAVLPFSLNGNTLIFPTESGEEDIFIRKV